MFRSSAIQNIQLGLFLILATVTSFCYAGNYIWNGNTSTAWATSSNWTPSGVPGSTDTVTIVTGSRNVYLAANTSVKQLTITSGTIDLQTYTLSVSATGMFTSGQINNGTLSLYGTSTITFKGTTFGAIVSATGNSILLNGSTFNDSLSVVKKGTAGDNGKGGNTFNGAVSIIDSSSGNLVLSDSFPDVFNSRAWVTNRSTGKIYIAHRGTSNQFNSDVTFAGKNIWSNYYGTASYNGNITFDTPNGEVYFGYSTGSCSLSSGKNLFIGSNGFSAGFLYLRNFVQSDSTISVNLTLTGSAKIAFESGTSIKANVTASAPFIYLEGTRFLGTCSITTTGSSNITSMGGSYFAKATTIYHNPSAACTFTSGSTSVDTFVSPVVLKNGIGTMSINNSLFLDSVTFKNLNTSTGSDRYYIANTGNARMKGKVVLDNALAGMNFGNSGGITTLDSSASLSILSSFTGNLTFKNFNQSGSNPVSITLNNNSTKLILNSGTSFDANFTYFGQYIQLNGATFNSIANITRYGTSNDISNGGNVFNGETILKDSSSHSNNFYLAYINPDHFNADVTFVQKGTSVNIFPAYTGNSTFKNDVAVDGTSAITFGLNGGKIIFEGLASQNLLKLASFIPKVKKLELKKDGNSLTLNFPLTIDDSLILTKGIILSDSINILILDSLTRVYGASDSSFVTGPVRKKGAYDFTFPLGDNYKYRPLTISSIATTSEFTASYYLIDPNAEFPVTTKDSSINNISRCEFWKLSSLSNSTASVSLKLSSNICNIDTISYLTIARWNGSAWKNDGYYGFYNSSNSSNTFTIGGLKLPRIANLAFTNTGYERGLYVDGFVKLRGSILDTAFSILGVTDVVSGHPTYNSYYKENQLLEYAAQNHIVYLTLYDLQNVYGQALTCKDSSTGSTMTMESHLCDFVNKARTKYCIEKIGVIGTSKSFFCQSFLDGTLPTDCINNALSSPPILRSSIPDPSNILSELEIIESSLPSNDSNFVRSEIDKFFIRLGLSALMCSATIDVLNLEHEFWNSTVSYNQYIQELTDMDRIKNWYNSLHNNKIVTEVYLGFLNKNILNTPIDVAADMDGSHSGIKPRLADRILEHHYTKSVFNPPYHTISATCPPLSSAFYYGTNSNCKLRSDYFKDALTLDKTNHRPIFSAESNYLQWTADFFGAWFPTSIRNNIYEAERYYYNAYDFDKRQSNLGNQENIMQPGSTQWFGYSLMGSNLGNPIIFRDTIIPDITGSLGSTFSPYCLTTGQAPISFIYQGPLEQGLKYEFSLKDNSGNKVFPISGLESGYTSDYSLIQNPGGNSSNVSLPKYQLSPQPLPYQAEITMTYDPSVVPSKCQYSYKKKIFISNTPLIEILEATNPLGPMTICENQQIKLIASAGSSYQWKLDGQNIVGAVNQEYSPTKTGNYTCCINCSGSGACDGISNVIALTFTSIPNHLIRIGCNSSSSVTLTVYPQISGETYLWRGSSSTLDHISVSTAAEYEVLITKGGCQTKARVFVQSNAFNVAGPSAPTVTPASSLICDGQSISVSVNSPDKTEGGAYFWSNGQTFWYNLGVLPTSNYPDPTAQIVIPGNYFLIYKAPNGCESDPTQSSSNVTVSAASGPIVDAGNDIFICSGTSANLSGASYSNGSNPVWTIQSGGTGTFGTNTFTPVSVGRYKLRLTVDGATPCLSSFDEVIVDVTSATSPTVTIASSKTNICKGENIEFNAITSGFGSSPTFVWQINGGGTVSTNRSFVTSVNDGDIVSVLVTGTSPSCINGIQATNSLTITVYENDIVPGISASPGLSVCVGTDVTLRSTVTSTNYLWSTGGQGLASIVVSETGNYFLQTVDAHGCVSPQSLIHIDIIDLALPQVTSNPRQMKFCPGQSLTPVTLNCYFPIGADSYTWRNVDLNQTYSGQSHVINASTSEAGAYVVEVTSGGCMKQSEPMYYGFVSNPNVSAYATLYSSNCATSTLNLNCTPYGGELPYTYLWNPQGYTTQSITNAPRSSYSVIITDVNGCTASSSVLNGLSPSIIPSVYSSICSGNTVVLTSSVSASAYSWNPGSASTKSISITPTSTTVYTLTITDVNGCTGTSTYQVNVGSSSLSTSVSSSSNSICVGGQVTLTCNTTSGVSYLWNNGENGRIIIATPQISPTTIYSVTITDVNGCTASATKSITVNSIPTVNITASGSNTFCNGLSVTLDAGSGFSSYLWSSTQTTQSISASTDNDFLCTVTNSNGCTNSAVTSVNILPLPNVTMNVSTNPICVGGAVTLTANGANSYIYNPAAPCEPCSTFTFRPSLNSTYTVTGTSTNGCTQTASQSIVVDQTCCGNYGSNFNATTGTFTQQNFNLNTSFSLTGDLTFSGCELAIASGVTITVGAGKTLTITDDHSGTPVIVSHLYSCGDMWGGIINSGGTVIIENGSVIEDAITALSINGGSFNIENNFFDNNYISLKIQNGSYPRTSSINNIIGNSFNNSSSELSKAPHAGEDSPEHIYLGNVTTIEIGEPGENPNNFLHGLIGINSQESTVLIQNNNFTNIGNNTFQNLRTTNPPPVYINPFGGIYSKKSSISIGSTTATLGTGLSKNTFTDCQLGVYANNNVLVDISENEFTLIGQAIYVSNSKNGNSRTLNIIGNTIDKYSVGIELNDVYLLASTNISDNLLNFNLGYDPSNYGYTGILIRNYSQGGGFYTLHNNWIENTRFGIHLNNISAAIKCMICPPDKEYFGLTVSNNHVKEVISTSDLSIDNNHIGIWLEDVRGGNLLVNNAFWTENPSGLGSETMQGIRLQKSLDCRLMQNVMTNMESGLMVFGDNSKTSLFCNSFENNYVATYFSDNNIGSNNILTDQGVAVFNPSFDPTLSYSWKNDWTNSGSVSAKVGGTPPPSTFNWLYKSSGIHDYYPGSFGQYFISRSCNNEISDCDPVLAMDEIKRDKDFGKVAYDSIPVNPDSLKLIYYGKEVYYN